MKPVSQFGHDLLLVCTQLLKKESTFILQLLVIFMLSASLIPTVRLALRTLEGSPQGTARTFWLEKGQILTMRPQATAPKVVMPPVKVASVQPSAITAKKLSFQKLPVQRIVSARVKYVGAQAVRPRSVKKALVPATAPNRPTQIAARPAVKNVDSLQQVRKTLKETYKVTQVKSYEESMQWARKTLEAYRQNT